MRFKLLVATTGSFLAIGLALTFFPYDLVRTPWLAAAIFCAVLVLALEISLGLAFNDNRKPVRAFLYALPGAFFLGMITSWVVFQGYLPALNAWFDNSPREQHRANVQRFGSGKTRRYVRVDSWRGNEFESLQLSTDLARARPQQVVVTTRAGFLGFEWVVDVAPAPP